MTHTDSSNHRTMGDQLAPFALNTLAHGTLHVPGSTLTHLQFRRFAGCPICNLHVQSFARNHARIEAAGVRTVALFHSPAESLRHQEALPFPVVADPERRWYRHFGVERSLLAVMHPKAMWTAMRGLVGASSNPLAGASEPDGLPADFLVSSAGVVVQAHYGKHADDQWSVDVLLALARGAQ